MFTDYRKAPNLMTAEMWKAALEAEGLPTKIIPEGDILDWGERVPFRVMVPKGREHVADEILRDFDREASSSFGRINTFLRWSGLKYSANSASSNFNICDIVSFDLMNELVVADRKGVTGLFSKKNSDECESKKNQQDHGRPTHWFPKQLGGRLRWCWSFCRSRWRRCVH